VGVDQRTVTRWESDGPEPTGTAAQILEGWAHALNHQSEPEKRATSLSEIAVAAVAFGGLAYLLGRLLTELADNNQRAVATASNHPVKTSGVRPRRSTSPKRRQEAK
jgi:hypothetical protein